MLAAAQRTVGGKTGTQGGLEYLENRRTHECLILLYAAELQTTAKGLGGAGTVLVTVECDWEVNRERGKC